MLFHFFSSDRSEDGSTRRWSWREAVFIEGTLGFVDGLICLFNAGFSRLNVCIVSVVDDFIGQELPITLEELSMPDERYPRSGSGILT